jgi:hypothetical protein
MYNNPGFISPKLAGAFTSEQEAERVLINHLKSGDRFGKAIYPQNV